MAKTKNTHAPTKQELSKAGRVLAKKGASEGGLARARNLTKEELSEQGRKAVQARWAKARAAKKKAGAATASHSRRPKVS